MPATRPVRSSSDPALIPLGSHEGKPPFPMTRPVFVIGSRNNARIHLVSSTVSQAHALLVRSNGGVYIRDLASRTKVIVNGKTHRETDLHNGDELQIGRFSFRFRGPDVPRQLKAAATARLRVAGQDLPVPIDQRVLLIGRRIVCDIHLLEESVSTVHAVIFEVDGQRFIRDLGSRTGTFVNGVSTHQHQLALGDKIRIGETDLTYEPGAAKGAADEPAIISPTAELAGAQALDFAGPTSIEPLDLLSEPFAIAEPDILDLPAQSKPNDAIELSPPSKAPTAQATPVTPIELEPIAEPVIEPEVLELPIELEPIAETPIQAEVLDLPVEVEPVAEMPAIEIEAPDAPDAPVEPVEATLSVEPIEQTPLQHEPLDLTVEAEPFVETASTEPEVIELPVEDVVIDATANIKPDSLESPTAADEPIELQPELLDLPAEAPVEFRGIEVEPIESPAELPPAELSEISVSDSLMPPEAMEAIPVAEEVGEPQLPPRDEVIAAVVAESPIAKKGGRKKPAEPEPQAANLSDPPRGKAAAIKARKLLETPVEMTPAVIEPPADLAEPAKPARGKGGKGKKPPQAKKQRGKPIPPAADIAVEPVAEAPVEPAPTADAIEPLVISEPTFVEPATLTPLGIVEPEIVEPEIVVPREMSELELSEPSARGPLIEPLDPETHFAAVSPEPILAAELAELPAIPLPAEVEKIAIPAEPAAPLVTDELPLAEAKSLDFGATSAPDIFEKTPDRALTDNDLLELEALLGEDEERPAAEVDRTVETPLNSATDTQSEAPDTSVDEELAVSPDDLLAKAEPGPLAEQTPDTVAAANSNETAEADISQTQASVLAERVRWMANHDNVLGGQPLVLPESEPSALSETPLADAVPHNEIAESDDVGQLPETAINGHSAEFSTEIRPTSQPRSLISFEALADSPLREIDVFSHMSPPAEEELIDAEVINSANGEAVEPPAVNGELRPRGTISGVFGEPVEPPAHRQRVRPELSGSISAMVHPVRGQTTEADARLLRRKYLRRVSTLVGLMVLLIGGAAVAIYNVVGVNGSVEAKLKFANLGSLKQTDRERFAIDQLSLLRQDPTRRLARRTLNERNPEIPPGFLDDQIEYVKGVDACGFSSSDPEVLLIRLTGRDPAADAARSFSMALALYQQDGTLLDSARKQRQGLDELNRSIVDSQTQLQAISDQVTRLRLSGESAPSLERRQQLDAQLSKTESDWTHAVAAVKSAEAELLRMKAVAPGSPADAPTTAPNVANDPQLLALQQQLTNSNVKLQEAHAAASKAAADARQNLDQTLSGFGKQVADAQGMAGNNPEFTAYIQSAQRLLETTRQLTDDLIHRQEKLLGKLSELKDQLNDRMEARRVEMWQSDKELADLNERQAIATRKLNTALGTGLQKEADDLKTEIELTKSMIKARQDLLPGDAFYSDTIQRLQNILDTQKKNIADDRATTEQQLTKLQQAFTSTQVVERLPEEQKQLAAALSQRLNDINAARQQYNQAVDAGAGDSDEQIKSQAVTIQASIEARQKQLAEANLEAMRARQERDRVAAIDAKESDLTRLRATEIGLQKGYFDTQKQVRDAQANADAAKDTSDKLDALIRQKGVLQADLDSKSNQVGLRQSQVSAVIEPQAPSEGDLVIRRGEDRRLLYTLSSGGALLLLFSGLILWTLHTAHLVVPHGGFQSTDLQPLSAEPAKLEAPADAEPAPV